MGDIITPHTKIEPDEYNEQVRRQVRSSVTVDNAELDAWLEIIDHYGDDDCMELSERARLLCEDHGIAFDMVEEYSIGDYLEGLLDYRTLRDSQGEILEVHLLVAVGGPNIWHKIDDEGNVTIELYWWGTRGTGHGQHELYARIFEYMSEVIACSS